MRAVVKGEENGRFVLHIPHKCGEDTLYKFWGSEVHAIYYWLAKLGKIITFVKKKGRYEKTVYFILFAVAIFVRLRKYGSCINGQAV